MSNWRYKVSLEDKSSSLFKRLIRAVILTFELLAGKTQQNSELRVMIRRNNINKYIKNMQKIIGHKHLRVTKTSC